MTALVFFRLLDSIVDESFISVVGEI